MSIPRAGEKRSLWRYQRLRIGTSKVLLHDFKGDVVGARAEGSGQGGAALAPEEKRRSR